MVIDVSANAITGIAVGILNDVELSEAAIVLPALEFPVPVLCSVGVLREVAVDASADVPFSIAVGIAADAPVTPSKCVMTALFKAFRWRTGFGCCPTIVFNGRSRRLLARDFVSLGCGLRHASMALLSSNLDCGEKVFWGLPVLDAYVS